MTDFNYDIDTNVSRLETCVRDTFTRSHLVFTRNAPICLIYQIFIDPPLIAE